MNWFDTYLARAQARKQSNLSFNQSQPFLQALNLETTRATDTIQGNMRLNGAGGMAIEDMRRNMRSGQESTAQSIFQSERDKMTSANSAIDDSIIQAQAQYDKQREEEKRAKKDRFAKIALELGGAATGAVVGAFAGNPMMGARIGAGAGKAASGFVGGGGKMALDQANPDEIIAGVTDTVSGISAATTLHTQKKDIGNLSTYLQKNIGSKDPAIQQNIKLLTMAIDSGNMELVRKIIGDVK